MFKYFTKNFNDLNELKTEFKNFVLNLKEDQSNWLDEFQNFNSWIAINCDVYYGKPTTKIIWKGWNLEEIDEIYHFIKIAWTFEDTCDFINTTIYQFKKEEKNEK